MHFNVSWMCLWCIIDVTFIESITSPPTRKLGHLTWCLRGSSDNQLKSAIALAWKMPNISVHLRVQWCKNHQHWYTDIWTTMGASGGSVMLWRAFCWHGFGPLVPLEGRVKSIQSCSEWSPLCYDETFLSWWEWSLPSCWSCSGGTW